MLVAGVDVWRGRWIAVALEDGALSCSVRDRLDEVCGLLAGAAVIGVDVPIGLPMTGRRRADEAVRPFLGARRSSVFYAPPADVIRHDTYGEALAHCRARHGFGVSAQAFALRHAIREAAAVDDERLVEVHPEASFREMAGAPLEWPKRSWNGHAERRRLLAQRGIDLDADLGPAGAAAVDDVLDAAAGAWSAQRVALGTARSFPDPPEEIGGRPVAIWC